MTFTDRPTVRKLGVGGLACLLVLSFGALRDAGAQVNGTLPGFVQVQPVTPGFAQTGHAHLTGTMKAGTFVGAGTGLSSIPWAAITGVPGGFAPIGPATGDLSGTYPGPVVDGLQGRPVSNAVPAAGQALVWNGVTWAPAADLLTLPFNATASATSPLIDLTQTGSSSAGRFANSNTNSSVVALIVQSNSRGGGIDIDTSGGTALRATASGPGAAAVTAAATGTGVALNATASSSYAINAVSNWQDVTNGAGINSTGYRYGIRGFATYPGPVGTGVYGEGGYGGLFVSNTQNSTGVGGSAPDPGGWGVSGQGHTYGVRAVATGTTGYGVSATGYYGVEAVSNGLIGVHGENLQTTGTVYGVYGETSSTSGRAVYGVSNAVTGTTYAVRGVNGNASGYAVYAAGDLGCGGNKAFVIDHPFDPANKYLKHYCTEGPLPQNAYNGVVTTDGNGWATIRLPDYFTAINKDPRVQLTADDSSGDFVMVKVVGGVTGNTFRIRSSLPRTKVYWEVKATRNDAWNQAHGAPVEVEKSPEERGKYQHPELFGQPKEKGIDYEGTVAALKAQRRLEASRRVDPK